MTVSTTIIKNFHNGNASTTNFAYQFRILEDTDLLVIIRTNSTGAEATKTLSTHYTVAGAGDASGGSITFTAGNIPASGETVVIRRNVPQTQAIDYIANDPFPAETHEEGLDRGTMVAQQVAEESDRSIKLSRTNTMTSTEFTVGATDRANKVLAFDSSGEISVTQELGTFKGDSATTTTAAFVQRDIVKATTAAQLNNIYICVADSAIGDSLTDTDHFELLVDAVSAATSAAAAAASATTAGNSATASANSATASANSATTSGNSATASASSATAAASSATDAAASADAFDDIYLGTKSSDPSTDNDGDALAAGMLYFNSTNDILRVYSGSAWQDAAISSTGVVTLTGTQTLTNKTLTAPKINEDVAVTSTATELNFLDGVPNATYLAIQGKTEGTNFANSLLVGHATTGTLSSAENNTAVGINALNSITSGDKNTVMGFDAGTDLTNGIRHTLFGYQAGANLTGGETNTFIGESAGYTASSNSSNNTGVGRNALYATYNDSYNTALGMAAGDSIQSGSNNLVLGAYSGQNITSGDGNVIIGRVDAASATGSRQLKIAGNDGSTTTTWISGSSAGVVTLNAANVTQQAITSSSNAVAWDASAKPNAVHITTENTTFSAPSNSIEGAFICVEINYNGSHSIAWNTVFEFAASTAPTFTSTDGKTDIMVFRYNGAVWQEVGRTINLSES